MIIYGNTLHNSASLKLIVKTLVYDIKKDNGYFKFYAATFDILHTVCF